MVGYAIEGLYLKAQADTSRRYNNLAVEVVCTGQAARATLVLRHTGGWFWWVW